MIFCLCASGLAGISITYTAWSCRIRVGPSVRPVTSNTLHAGNGGSTHAASRSSSHARVPLFRFFDTPPSTSPASLTPMIRMPPDPLPKADACFERSYMKSECISPGARRSQPDPLNSWKSCSCGSRASSMDSVHAVIRFGCVGTPVLSVRMLDKRARDELRVRGSASGRVGAVFPF